MMKHVMFVLVIGLFGFGACDVITPPSGPGTAYPCGLHGHSCGNGYCCADGEECGNLSKTCPADSCCWYGDDQFGSSADSGLSHVKGAVSGRQFRP